LAVEKNLSSPFSTGGGGFHFEARVQALFVLMMLTGGYAPGLPCWPITETKLYSRNEHFEIDSGLSNSSAPLLREGLLKHNPLSGKMLDKMLKVKW